MNMRVRIIAVDRRILAIKDRVSIRARARGVHGGRLLLARVPIAITIKEAARVRMNSRARIIAIPAPIGAAVDIRRETRAIIPHRVDVVDLRVAVSVAVHEACRRARIMALVRIITIPAPIGSRMDIADLADLGAGAARPDRIDLSRLIEEGEAVAILIGIAARERLAPAITELRRVRIAGIHQARVGVFGRALDAFAGEASSPARHLDAALADGAEIVIEAFVVVVAAEGAVDLAAIAEDEVAIIAFLAGIEDAIAAGG